MKNLLCVAGSEFVTKFAGINDQPDGESDGQADDCDDPQVVDHEWFGVLGRLVRNTWTVRVVVEVIP